MQDSVPNSHYTESTTQSARPHNNASHTEVITLATKYRPKLFSELIGQESVARTLCLALDTQKIAHAYLFSGLRGSGKTSSARIFARCLQCESGISSHPCGVCASCESALKGNNIDIIELDGASNRKIDDIRELIEQTKYKPSLGRFKVFIIDEVHMLTKEAFNSLLKTLEEPPNHVKFILATTDPLKVPPTILSRTQHFRFKKIPINVLKNYLTQILHKENILYDNESIDMIIRNGHGSVRDTLTLLDQAIIFCQNHLSTNKLADMLGALDLKSFDTLFNALLQKNKQECINFVKTLDGYETEMVLDSLSLYIKDKLMQDRIMPIMAMRYANIIADAKALLQLDCDGDFCLLLTILKMLEAQKIKDIESSIQQLESHANFYYELDKATVHNNTNMANTPPYPIETNHAHTNVILHNPVHTDSDSQTQSYKTQDSSLESPILKPAVSQLDSEISAQTQDETQHHVMDNSLHNHLTSNTAVLDSLTSNSQSQESNTRHSLSSSLQQQYIQMLNAISERDFNTGEIFEKFIVLERIDSTYIYLTSYTNEEQNNILRQSYKGILDIARHIFGSHIKIKVEKKAPYLHPSMIQKKQDFTSQDSATKDSTSQNTTTHLQHSKDSSPPSQDSFLKADSSPSHHKESHHENDDQARLLESTSVQPSHHTQNITLNQEKLQDFVKENQRILSTIKNELGINTVKFVDYK
ncbi:DNA polymerase III subunit gamma/tau [Helicobacter sp. MIT 14-3879]|nr:DNA polymerase III subunit gamma/tau [Helicobacter sp. MIT 14-3879]